MHSGTLAPTAGRHAQAVGKNEVTFAPAQRLTERCAGVGRRPAAVSPVAELGHEDDRGERDDADVRQEDRPLRRQQAVRDPERPRRDEQGDEPHERYRNLW